MTSQHSKHPDWDEIWKKVQNWDWNWLLNYIKSHDLNQCRDEQGNTLVHHAVCDKNLDAIACLSDFFIDPNIKNAAGQTALQLAQDAGPFYLLDLDKYHLCIDFAKASSEPNGLEALFAAIYRGDTTLGDTSGVEDDGNEKNAGGWTALHCAVVYDCPQLIHELHKRFPKLDADYLNYNRSSSLRLAAMYGHSNCIIALCECFPAIEARDALHFACEYDRPACIPALRKYFPQLNRNELASNYGCSSALICAAFYNNPKCIRALHSCFPDIDPNLPDSYGRTALFAAAQHPKSPECIPVLSECFPNIDPNKQDTNGDTALMHASDRGFSQSVTLFATCFPNTDVNMRNKEGKTALMLAIEYNRDEECIVALCEFFPNIDPNIQDGNGETALMFAIRQDNPKPIISQLHKFFPDIDPNAQNQSGQTILMIAARQWVSGPIISQLHRLFPNIDPNTQDKHHNTALVYIFDSFYEYMPEFLDKFPSVDAKIKNARGETVLTLAIQRLRAPIVALLLERFPDIISLTNSAGQAALMLATKQNNTKMISMLLKHISQID